MGRFGGAATAPTSLFGGDFSVVNGSFVPSSGSDTNDGL